MAVPKHLGAYSLECYNSSGGDNPYPDGCTPYRNTFNAVVDEIDLRETYFPGWAAGPWLPAPVREGLPFCDAVLPMSDGSI